MEITRVMVVGAGAMGSQIALACARAGYDVVCQDVSTDALERARTELEKRSERDVAKGRREASDQAAAWSRLTFGTDVEQLAPDVDLVIEAAVEDVQLKRRIFAEMDRVAPRHAILATNSSSFVPSRLADATTRPDQFCNIHFFNPALVMACVEIVAGPDTSSATIDAAREFVLRLDKTPIVLEKEIPGFVANRILNAVRDEAIHLYESVIRCPPNQSRLGLIVAACGHRAAITQAA